MQLKGIIYIYDLIKNKTLLYGVNYDKKTIINHFNLSA